MNCLNIFTSYYSDVGEKVDEFYWLPFEPIMFIGENDCVAYGQRSYYYFKWKIVPYSERLLYICKHDLYDTSSTINPGSTGGHCLL